MPNQRSNNILKFLWFSDDFLRQRTLIAQIVRKFRRFYFSYFKPDYVQKSIESSREGECHRCGACCRLVYRCQFLGYDDQKLPFCRVYGTLRPGSCKNYPFDSVDSEIDQCGFKFK